MVQLGRPRRYQRHGGVMPEDILYVLEKFQLAVMGLATSTLGLRERLTDAYISNFVQLNTRDLPPEIRQEFQGLTNALSRVSTGGKDGTLAVSAATLSDDEARRLIQSIVSMYQRVAELAIKEE
jgi:hypothetical protein